MTVYLRPWSTLAGEGSVGRSAFVARSGLWDEQQTAVAEQVRARLGEVDYVRLAFCDPHGVARSKTLTARTFASVLHNGMDFSPGPFVFDTGHAVAVDFRTDPGLGVAEIVGAGDFVVVPDPRTFQLLPGPEGGARTAWVLGDEYLRDGTPHPFSSRHVLRRVLARYAARDLAPVVGLEVEWYLTRRLGGPPGNAGNGFGRQGEAPRVEAMNAGYQFNSDAYYDSVAPVVDRLGLDLMAMGLPLRSLEHESGPGQVESTFEPMLALDSADAMLLFRTYVKRACARRGHHASFMALPQLPGFDPSGWHLHQSVTDTKTGRNVFGVDGDPDALSADGRAYAAGILARAREFCLLSVPTVNGYRRLDAAYTLSPTVIGWSFEDRTAMVRALGGEGSAHLENRVGEPNANPYLLMASQLAAGLDGIDDGAEVPADPGVLPQSLREAVDAFGGPAAEALLGAPLTEALRRLKRSEVDRFETWLAEERPDDGVTDWEQREYFDIY